jgi:hypothetical protein
MTVTGKPGGRHSRTPEPRRTWRGKRLIAILVTLIVMIAIVTFAALFTYDHVRRPAARPSTQTPTKSPAPVAPQPSGPAASPPLPAPNDPLAAEFASLQAKVNAKLGVVVGAVGGGQNVTTLGNWKEGKAWSTIKVPLVIAAYRQQSPQQVTDAMRAAITESDNAAAESVWAQLGEPQAAGQKVEQVLRETGDPTTVEWKRVRPPYTAFGQTDWSLTNQVRFLASAACNSKNDPIFALMGQVVANQSWGIGDIPGTQFKGGWGPSPSGNYLVRQIGILTTPTGKIAVAIAAEPASGQFNDGTKALGEVANWLTQHFGSLPTGKCGE